MAARYSDMRELHGVALNVVVGLAQQEAMAASSASARKAVAGRHRQRLLVLGSTLLCLWAWQGAPPHPRAACAGNLCGSDGCQHGCLCAARRARQQGEISDFAFFDTNSRAER
jgi:hypothetical protein